MKLKETLIYRNSDGIIFDTEKGKLIELNESANKVVSYLCNGVDIEIDELCAKMLQEYPGSDEKEIAEYVAGFIEKLKEIDALR